VKLTQKQKKFCHEFLVDLNGTQSAIRAGYSVKGARQGANETMSKPYIQQYLKKLMEKQQERTQITADSVIKELASIGFAEIDEDIKASDKNKSLELLGKHLGMFTQKTEVELTDGRSNADFKAMFESMSTDDKLQWLKEREKDNQIIEG